MIDYKKDGDTKRVSIFDRFLEKFCDRHECDLIVMEELIVAVEDINIKRYYLFDMLDSNKIDYGQILLVDVFDTIVHQLVQIYLIIRTINIV